MPAFSVLLSVYSKEKPQYLHDCLSSLATQTLAADQIVLVEDGPIGVDLQQVINGFKPTLAIQSVVIKTNVGLAGALNEGLKHCAYDLVARMDTDDVALPTRFEKQIAFMLAHPEVDVSSAWIEERDQEMQTILSIRKLPTTDAHIASFAKRRNPISHPAAIFRKSAVSAVGGYPLVFPEDYALWSLMLQQGFHFANIPEVLLHMRTGKDFLSRRGLNFLKGEIGLLKYQKRIGFLSSWDFFINLLIRSAVRLPPAWVKKILYKLAR